MTTNLGAKEKNKGGKTNQRGSDLAIIPTAARKKKKRARGGVTSVHPRSHARDQEGEREKEKRRLAVEWESTSLEGLLEREKGEREVRSSALSRKREREEKAWSVGIHEVRPFFFFRRGKKERGRVRRPMLTTRSKKEAGSLLRRRERERLEKAQGTAAGKKGTSPIHRSLAVTKERGGRKPPRRIDLFL